MDTQKDPRLAVLIDADNVAHSHVQGLLEEIAKYGNPTFKRIYADWTKPTVSGWKAVLLENAITPVQQYSYTSGKNATDSAMIIDAMDILYTGRVDGFCIVSSDSDFTRLATRLREAGMKVFGLGEKKTPISFISACDKFIYLEILKENRTAPPGPYSPSSSSSAPSSNSPAASASKTLKAPGSPAAKEKPKANARTPKKEPAKPGETAKQAEINPETTRQTETNQETTRTEAIRSLDEGLIRLIADSINDLAGEDGWTFLGELGNLLLKKKPDFDPRNYGFKKLVPLIKSIDRFEIDERDTGRNKSVLAYVRAKETLVRP
ncbi:MAG: NYN domain-containing protein [Puia sp.]|nr:NYN domain-containing protein [Puia sp.]